MVVNLIGKTEEGLITITKEGKIEKVNFLEFPNDAKPGIGNKKKELLINNQKSDTNFNEEIIHASLKLLNKHSQGDEENDKKAPQVELYFLLGLIRKRFLKHPLDSPSSSNSSQKPSYFASLLLIKESYSLDCVVDRNSSNSSRELKILEEISLLEDEDAELQMHLLSTSRNSSEESDADTTEESLSSASYKNSVVLLSLEKCK